MQKIIKITIIFLLIFILGIFFLSLNKNSNYNTESLVGNKLGEIELVSFEDDSIFTNDDFKKNSFTLINFWASWCAPCRVCLLYTSPSPRDRYGSRMPSSA